MLENLAERHQAERERPGLHLYSRQEEQLIKQWITAGATSQQIADALTSLGTVRLANGVDHKLRRMRKEEKLSND